MISDGLCDHTLFMRSILVAESFHLWESVAQYKRLGIGYEDLKNTQWNCLSWLVDTGVRLCWWSKMLHGLRGRSEARLSRGTMATLRAERHGSQWRAVSSFCLPVCQFLWLSESYQSFSRVMFYRLALLCSLASSKLFWCENCKFGPSFPIILYLQGLSHPSFLQISCWWRWMIMQAHLQQRRTFPS